MTLNYIVLLKVAERVDLKVLTLPVQENGNSVRWWVCQLTLLRHSFRNTHTLMYQIIMLYTIFWVSLTSGKLEKEISGSWRCFMVFSRWGYVYGRAVSSKGNHEVKHLPWVVFSAKSLLEDASRHPAVSQEAQNPHRNCFKPKENSVIPEKLRGRLASGTAGSSHSESITETWFFISKVYRC